jgi:hypothetical protein
MPKDAERTKSFYRVWVDPCYWLDKYIQGYSELDIQIPNVYEGIYQEDPKYRHPDRGLLNPPSARREKKKGRTKQSRHTSGGEVGRKNGRTKKKKEKSVASSDEPPDEDIHGKPYGSLFGDWSSIEPEKAASERESDETLSPDSAGERAKPHNSRPSVSNAAMTMASHPEVVIATSYIKPASLAAQPAAQLSADGQDKNRPRRTVFVFKRGMTLPGGPRRSDRLHGPQLQEKAASKEQNASPSHGDKAKLRTPPPKVIKAGKQVKGGRRLYRRGQPDPQPQKKKKKTKKATKKARKKKKAAPRTKAAQKASKSTEQTPAEIRERLEAGLGSDEGNVGSD